MGNSEQGCELCLRHCRECLHRFCCRRGARQSPGWALIRDPLGLGSPPPCSHLLPKVSAPLPRALPSHHRAGGTSRSISLHPTALGMDLFKTLETPKSHSSAAFRAHSLGIKMMWAVGVSIQQHPLGQAKDVMQQ